MKKPLFLWGLCVLSMVFSPYLTQAQVQSLCDTFSASIVKKDVSCSGLSDGFATIIATGGQSPYSYNWDNNAGNATTSTITGLSASVTIYSAMVSDANGCKTTVNVKIYEPAPLSLNCTGTNPSCVWANDGTATAGASGGTQPYSYQWDQQASFQTTATATGLFSGTYHVTVTDNNGCSDTCSVTIQDPPALFVSFSVVDILCHGLKKGSITANPIGGAAPYTYKWDASAGGKTSKTVSGLAAGVYSVTVTDSKGCLVIGSDTIHQPSMILGKTSKKDVLCNGKSDGSATILAMGGTAPYSFKWNDAASQTTSKATGLSAGKYMATITDANGCKGIGIAMVNQPDSLDVNKSQSDNLCAGAATGSASVSVSGGTSPYSYEWSTGSTASSISNLAGGTYSVTITDDNSCQKVEFFTILEPNVINIAGIAIPVSCKGACDGIINTFSNGGTPPIGYSWDNGMTTAVISGLCAGTYTVTVTDVNGCTASMSYTVTEPDSLLTTLTKEDIDCNGAGNGQATAHATGGNPPYSYSWSNGQFGSTATALSPGLITVTVTDGKNCTTSGSIQIDQPEALGLTGNVTPVTCNGDMDGSITTSVSGGTDPYSYAWSHGPNTANVSGLNGGSYTVTVTDANFCTISKSFTIDEPDSLEINPSFTNVTCKDACDGTASVSITGGNMPYASITWSNGATTSSISGLCDGEFTVTVVDAKGCSTSSLSDQGATPNAITISQPPALSVIVTKSPTNCIGSCDGSASASPSGGTPPYTYAWSHGPITSSVANLCTNTYSVTVMDANGCSVSDTITVTQPPSLNLSLNVTNVSCSGGADGKLTAKLNGGTPPYSFLWSNGSTSSPSLNGLPGGFYSLTVTDANGCTVSDTATIFESSILTIGKKSANVSCNGSCDGAASAYPAGGKAPYTYLWDNGSTNFSRSGLCAGSYKVTVTDANGCTATNTIFVFQPSGIFLKKSSTDASCDNVCDGSASVQVNGGTGPFTFAWSNGATSNSISGLCGGTYTVTVTDANGCTASTSFNIFQAPPISITKSSTNASCAGICDGTASVTVNTGTPPFAFLWNTGATTASISNLCGGQYSVVVTDANGCTASDTCFVLQNPPMILSKVTTDASCFGLCDGSATVNVTGGVPPFSFSWNTGSTSQSISSICAGSYTVTVTDNNGCTASATCTIAQPDSLVAGAMCTPITCFGAKDGTATSFISGGTGPYVLTWFSSVQHIDTIPPSSFPMGTNLGPGFFFGVVVDANGCTDSLSCEITEPDSIDITADVINVSCFGFNDGAIDLTASGGTSPLQFAWSNGATTEDLSNLGPGKYMVTVTDANGCFKTRSYILNEPDSLVAIATCTPVTCYGGSDGAASSVIIGGRLPYVLTWFSSIMHIDTIPPSPFPADTGLSAGFFYGVVVDANGCKDTLSCEITQPDSIDLTIQETNVSCNGANDGVAIASASGGNGGFTYSWSTGANTAIINGLSAGTYTVTATDSEGCAKIASVIITEPDPITLNFNTSDASCFGGNDGYAVVTPKGGAGPFTYLWDNGSTKDSISGLSGGQYCVTVTYGNNCTVSACVTVTQSPSPVAGSLTATDVSCPGDSDGKLTISASGGKGPYDVVSGSFTFTFNGNPISVDNIPVGTYEAIITDQNGCADTVSASVGEPDSVKVEFLVTPTTCRSLCDGKITMTISGGNGNYGYIVGGIDNIFQYNNPVNATGLCAGNYFLTVGDDNLCIVETVVNVPQPPAVTVSTSSTSPLCVGDSSGTATATPGGGNGGPYTYIWNDPQGQTTSTATGLKAGLYFVSVEDFKGCGKLGSVTITEPTGLSIVAVGTPVTCFGDCDGSALASANGGTSPYTYLWDNGQDSVLATGLCIGTYTVTVTDANGCTGSASAIVEEPNEILITKSLTIPTSCTNTCDGEATVAATGGSGGFTYLWDNGQTTATATGLCAGSHGVTVTDKNGCKAFSTLLVLPGTPINVSIDPATKCAFQPINLTASINGGKGSYTYNWSVSAGNLSSSSAASPVYTMGMPGTYQVILSVSDSNGCTGADTSTITVQSVTTTTIGDTVCAGSQAGVASVIVTSSPKPQYTYAWSDNKAQTTAIAFNLTSGTYTVTVTDGNGCTTVDTAIIVEVPKVDIFRVPGQTKQPTCFGDKDGKIVVSANNGFGALSYQWDATANSQTSATATGLGVGTYCVTVTDELGCSDSLCYFLDEPKPLTLMFDTTGACSNCNGNAVVSVLGNPLGIGLSFNWSNGDMDQFNFGLCAGTYSITVSDTMGCFAIDSVEVAALNCRSGDDEYGMRIDNSSNGNLESRVFPNPFVGVTNLVVKSYSDKNINVRLYNLMGEQVQNLYNGPVGITEELLIKIDANRLPPGTYLYQIISDNEIQDWGRIISIKE